jgi:thiol-disulfide isomerase/thioredoxin
VLIRRVGLTRNLLLLLSVACLVAVAVLSGERVLSSASEEGALADDTRVVMQTLPHFYGPRVTDATFGDKVLIVTFFASWCPPCRQEFADLSDLYRQYREAGLEVVAINLFEDFDNFSDDERLAAFLELTQPPFTVVKGNDAISQQFGTIRRIPSLFVFDRQGRRVLAFAHERGAQATLDAAALRQVVSPLL